MAPSVEFAGPFWLGFAQETNGIAKGKLMVARCKVAGTGQESPISFNSQPQAYWPSKMAMYPVRLIVLAWDFVVLDGCWNGGDADRHRGKRYRGKRQSSGLLDLFFTHQFCGRSK